MRQKRANPEQVVAFLAARQHGVISTAQLESAGFDGSAIRRRVAAGRLHRLHRGVYAVGHPNVTYEGRCLAALLAFGPCGSDGPPLPDAAYLGRASGREDADGRSEPASPGAAISHRSAAELWEFMPRARGPIHVTVPAGGGRKQRAGLIVHRSRTLVPGSVAFIAGVRATTPARTLADLRPALAPDLHDRATRRALDLGLISRGADVPDTALTRSSLEQGFLALCRRHRLPKPAVNARIGRYEVDFLWRDQRVVVEADGFEHHGTRDAFERDRARDADLQCRGYRVLRVTHRQLRAEPRRVAGSVRRLLAAPAGPPSSFG